MDEALRKGASERPVCRRKFDCELRKKSLHVLTVAARVSVSKSLCVRYESVPLCVEGLRQAENRLSPHMVVGDGWERPPHHGTQLGGERRNRTDTKLREVLEPRAHRAAPLIRRQHGGHVAACGIRRSGCDCRAKFGGRDRRDPSGDSRNAQCNRSAFALRGRHKALFAPLLSAETCHGVPRAHRTGGR